MKRRALVWAGSLFLFLIVVLSIRESLEPLLLLHVDEVLGRSLAPTALSLGDGLDLLAYVDTRPHIGKIDELQKGLVLVVDGKQRIEEGFGFGVPIVRYGDLTYLSRRAHVSVAHSAAEPTLVKRYEIAVADYPVAFLRRKYRDVAPRGTVVVTYTVVNHAEVGVTVDLSELSAGWDEVFLMNEQGARGFTRYQEGTGEIWAEVPGIWEPVTDRCGCWIDPRRMLRFCVETDEAVSRFIGRERYNQYYWAGIYTLSWSGVDIHMMPPDHILRYSVHVGRLPADEGTWGDVPCS